MPPHLQAHISAALLFTLITGMAAAQAPEAVSFQGRLTNPVGVPIDSTVDITFTLYDGSDPIWTETQVGVVVDEGIVNTVLGTESDLDTLAFDRPFELGVSIGGMEFSPRTLLAASAYSRALPGLYTQFRVADFDKSFNVVGGSPINTVANSATAVTIGGGGGVAGVGSIDRPNIVLETGGTISGGWDNTVNTEFGTIGGGRLNSATGENSTIGGGISNTTDGLHTTVAGGTNNTASNQFATVGGGTGNDANGLYTTVSGGGINDATANQTTIGGGFNNEASGFGLHCCRWF